MSKTTTEPQAARELLVLINHYRESVGAPLLNPDSRLTRAAAAKMACFATNNTEPVNHTCGGVTAPDMRANAGYTARGAEILCWSERTAQDAFDAWRASPVHDAVMRDPQYHAIGIAGPETVRQWWGTWVVEFGTEAPASKPVSAPVTGTSAPSADTRKEIAISFATPISTIPAPLRTGGTISRDTPIRLIGDCRKDVARGVLDYAKSPVMPEFDAVFEAIAGHSVALLAIMAKETEYGRTANVRNNGWNTIDGTSGGFTVYASWAEGAKAAARRFTDYSYKGGLYEPEITVAEFLQTWQGGPECRTSGYARCANGETRESIELAIGQFLDRANRIIRVNGESATTPSTTTTPAPTTSPGKVTFGRVPRPAKYSERFIAPHGPNTAFDWVDRRILRGWVLHRMIGTLIGTDSYFRREAAASALTDFGIGNGGNIYRWTEPGAAIAPYASGASSRYNAVPSGDGVRFVERYGWRQNPDCEAIELEGLRYEDPVPTSDYQALVGLLAWRADSAAKISYTQWPKNNEGEHALYWHNEFQNEKACPGSVVMAFTDRLIEDVRAVLKQYQTA